MNEAQLTSAKTAMLYGDSGLGKSTQAAVFARYIYGKTGKVVRLISAEDSSKAIFDPLINAGIVDAYFMTRVAQPEAVLRKLSRGMWPVEDKPYDQWMPYDERDIGGYVIEGLTSISELLLESARQSHRFLAGQSKDVYTLQGENFGPAGMSAYSFVQDEMLASIKAFAALPGLYRVLWTAHETVKGTDADKIMLRGPALVGTAKTQSVQKFCGVLMHVDGVVTDDKITKSRYVKPRIWFRQHTDPLFPAVYYPAKFTLPLSRLEEWNKHFPLGYIEPTVELGIDSLLELEEQLQRVAVNELTEWKKQVQSKLGGE